MSSLSDALAGSYRPEQVVDHVAHAVLDMFSPHQAVLAGNDYATGTMGVLWNHNADDSTPESVHIERALTDGAFEDDGWMAAPLLGGHQKIGALCVRLEEGRVATPDDLNVLRAVAAQAAMGLRNAWLFRLLSEGKREWEQTVDAIGQAFCLVDDSGLVRRINAAFSKMIGVPVTAVNHRKWLDLVPQEWISPISDLLASQEMQRQVQLVLEKRTIQVTALGLESAGDLKVLVFDDLTEKKALQEQLVQSAKMSAVGQLISGVAHDLNNPLASVIGLADYLSNSDHEIPAEIREPLKVIHQEAERAASIVGNLLGFARKQEDSTETVSVNDLLASTISLLRNQMMQFDVELNVDIEDGLPPVQVNCNRIQQVFVNLITNAAQAVNDSGVGTSVAIRASPWLSGVAIVIEDDGPGIPAPIREQIFEPFFTTKGDHGGTGLGLSICQGIVKEHGGRLVLLDNEVSGATFRVELPASVGTVPVEPELDSSQELRAGKILVVDDEPNIRYYLTATLEAWGHSVESVEDATKAIQRLEVTEFDAILSDVRMPGLSGRDFYEYLTREMPEVTSRVVFCTGDTVQNNTLEFLEDLGRPYLTKPFTLNGLRTALASVIHPAN